MAKKKKTKKKKVKKSSDSSYLEADFYNYALNNSEEFDLKIDKGGWGHAIDIIQKAQNKDYSLKREYISLFIKQKDEMKIRGLKFLDNGYVKSTKNMGNDVSIFEKLKNEKNN